MGRALRLTFAAAVFTASLAGQMSLQITSPAEGTTISPGQTVKVHVNVTGGPPKAPVIIATTLGFFSEARTAPPWDFVLHMPETGSAGVYYLTAVTADEQGLIASRQVSFHFERTDEPIRYRVDYSSLTFTEIGDRVPLLVWATYADGKEFLVSESSKTSYRVISQGPPPVSVSAAGEVTSLRPGKGMIEVNGTNRIPVTVELLPSSSRPDTGSGRTGRSGNARLR